MLYDRLAGTTDKMLHLQLPGDPAHYKDANNVVSMRLVYTQAGIVFGSWNAYIDMAIFRSIP